ncbi:MAG: hypothetical protein V4507_01160 [Verrucomicrobiota bacterium]
MSSLLHPEKPLGTIALLYLKAVLPTLFRLPNRLPDSFPKGISGFFYLLQNAKKVLEPKTMPEGDWMTAHLRGSMSMVAASLPVMAHGDEATREMLSTVPLGLLQLCVPEAGVSIWIDWDGTDLRSDWGMPPRNPDVLLDFKNSKTAYLAFSKRLDELSAIGSGDLVLTGMIPLADGLNAVMNRVDFYLKS